MEVLAIPAHAKNAEHVRMCRLGKGTNLLRVGAVAVRTLDFWRTRGRVGFTGGLGRIPSRIYSSAFGLDFFPKLSRTLIKFG